MAMKISNAYPSAKFDDLEPGELFVDIRPGGWGTYMKALANSETCAVLLESSPKQDTPRLVHLPSLDIYHAQVVEAPELAVDPGPFGVAVPGAELKNGTVIVSDEGSVLCVDGSSGMVFFDLQTGVARSIPEEVNARHQVWSITGVVRGMTRAVAKSADDGTMWE